jgi:hypothetical protein
MLVEWGGSPSLSLPSRLRAADALAGLFGVHEQLLLRALSANESIVLELQV